MLKRALMEPRLGVVDLGETFNHMLNTIVKALPSISHGDARTFFHPALDVSLDAVKLIVCQLDTEVGSRHRQDHKVHAELVAQITDIGVVLGIVEGAKEPLCAGLEGRVVRQELTHHLLPLCLALAVGSHEAEVVGSR